MSYTDQLCTLPLDRLKEIVRRRAFQIRSVPRMRTKRELCAWLAQALSDAYAVRRAFDETDLMQARLLTFVVAQGGEPSREAILSTLGQDARERVEVAADGLESLGLAVRQRAGGSGDSWTLWTPDAVRRNVPLPLPVRFKLQPTLERYDGQALYHMVGYLGIAHTGLTSKAARARAIAHKLLDPGVTDLQEGLSEEARRILDFVLRRGGATNLHELGLQLDTRRRNQLYSYDWSYRWYATSPRNPVEELLSCGLLVLSGEVGFQYGAILVAGDVLERITGQNLLTSDLPELPPWETTPASGEPIRSHDSIGRDIAYFLGYLSRNPAGRTGKGIIHRTALKNVAKALSAPTVPYAMFLYALCREAGLIDIVERDESYGITPEGDGWLRLKREERDRLLTAAWLRQRRWVEIAPAFLLDDTDYIDREVMLSVRRMVIDLLCEVARERPGDLVSAASLSARAGFVRWSYFSPDLDQPGDGAADLADEPDTLTGAILVQRVAAALYWLGLVEGVGSRTTLLARMRLTALGRAVLLEEPRGEPQPESDSFVVQPNLEIYAPPNLATELYFGLFRIADPKEGGMLALSKDSLRKAMDRGMMAKDVLDFLRSHSSSGLPQNVEYLVREVGGKHGHIRVGHAGLYVVVDDPILLKELAAQKKLSIHVRRQLSDTVALITGDSVDGVLKQLRQAGYLPVADQDDKRQARTATRKRWREPDEGESAATVLASIDWERIAEEAPPAMRASGETRAPAIREILESAIRLRQRVEYAGTRDPAPDQVVIAEPMGLAGSLLRVYLPNEKHFGILNVSQIRWARLTDEVFEPKAEPARLSRGGG